MASGNFGLIQPYMFEPETDSEADEQWITCIQFDVSEW